MLPRTIYLSKLFGLSCILVALPMMFHKQAVVEMVTGLFRDPHMMFLTGVLTLVAGLAMVLAHNIWSGGALPVVVTIFGWLTLIKGFMFLLLFAGDAAGLYLGTLHYSQFFYLYMAICLVLGAYLTWGGFAAKASS
jgi:putative exporter of polyketide antibiotics